MSTENQELDAEVIVVGGGNAGFTAAHAARERGRSVILLEAGSDDSAGGNSFYTAGATRIVHNGIDDLTDLVEADDRHSVSEVPPYSKDEYIADLVRVTEGRTDLELADVLAEESHSTLSWLKSLGLKYRLMYERQAYERPDGSYLFWGGLHVGNVDGGQGLIADHTAVAKRMGTDVRYGHRATELLVEDGQVRGVSAETPDGTVTLRAESIVLTAGGFEADAEIRAEHMGERWANAKVRGTPLNKGDMLRAALDLGAARGGDWSSATASSGTRSPRRTNRTGNSRTVHPGSPTTSAFLSTTRAQRFLDEGADFRNYTYAKYGKVILEQPDSTAYQIFDR